MSSEDLTLLNRQAINAAKRYMGRPAWGTLALTLAVAIAYTVTLTLAVLGALPLLAAYLLLATLTYFSYTPLHEAAHGNNHGERVPFYRYHALFREVAPVLRDHGGTAIGVFSRQPLPATREIDQ